LIEFVFSFRDLWHVPPPVEVSPYSLRQFHLNRGLPKTAVRYIRLNTRANDSTHDMIKTMILRQA